MRVLCKSSELTSVTLRRRRRGK